jgi:HPt (histidine-containing phosphotransfer) domain-containing protein
MQILILRILAIADNKAAFAKAGKYLKDLGHDVIWRENDSELATGWFDLVLKESDFLSETGMQMAIDKRAKEIFANPIDPKALEHLKVIDASGGLVQELVRLFGEMAPKEINQIRANLKIHDIEKVNAAAHSLKSTCRNVGCSRMADICSWIELAKESDEPSLQIWVKELDRLFEEYKQILKKHEAA